ncbi:MAG TPA: TetR/AcrR family transcriptional regulator [Rhizomicrobium sp.]|jgi:AcrR family transcriptional regulator|nr:TetR/AcrR family transcriptional regulator [Rhizomicrobium sp.]
MDTRQTLLAAALRVLEREGEAQFSTRAVCALADVTAPTLYHHFGSADGLLSAAVMEAFAQFLAGKRAAVQSSDAETALAQGWDNYVRFAADRPRLYAAMVGRFLQGAKIPAADQARALLMERIAAIAAEGRLALDAEAAADLAWASAHAAALLYVTAATRKPSPRVIAGLRDGMLQTICKPRKKAGRA